MPSAAAIREPAFPGSGMLLPPVALTKMVSVFATLESGKKVRGQALPAAMIDVRRTAISENPEAAGLEAAIGAAGR